MLDDRSATRQHTARREPTPARKVREALAPYINLKTLRSLAATPGADIRQALIGADAGTPEEVLALIDVLAAILRPVERQQVRSPADVAALLMVEMGFLDQEQIRVICLDGKNRIQKIVLVYQGNVNSTTIRVGEIFKEALRLNSVGLIVVHNHPSGASADPSPEDVLVTREIVAAGKLLDIETLDHVIVCQGHWVSLRQRGLGFEKSVTTGEKSP
jgi:DNA repair protein RadC